MSSSLRLEYAGFRVRVRSTASAHLLWLEEFLSPWFTAVAGPRGDGVEPIVTLTCDARRLTRLLAAPPSDETASKADVFVLDSRVVRHPVWREQDSERLIFDEDLRVFYRVSHRRPHVRILAGDDPVATRVALMRVVRELAMVYVQGAGRLLHAAAVDIGGRAIAMIGPKRAGKTSLLLHLLRAPGARFVANDRVLADLAGSTPQLTGMPSIVALRPGTLELLPAFRAQVADRGYAFWHTIAESRMAPSTRPTTAGSDVTPAQLCDLAHVEATAGAPIAALVFPHVSGQPDRGLGLDLERLPPEIAERRLRAGLFGGADIDSRSAAFGTQFAGERGDSMSPDTFCLALSRAVPAFNFRLGPGTFADPKTAADLADRLTKTT